MDDVHPNWKTSCAIANNHAKCGAISHVAPRHRLLLHNRKNRANDAFKIKKMLVMPVPKEKKENFERSLSDINVLFCSIYHLLRTYLRYNCNRQVISNSPSNFWDVLHNHNFVIKSNNSLNAFYIYFIVHLRDIPYDLISKMLLYTMNVCIIFSNMDSYKIRWREKRKRNNCFNYFFKSILFSYIATACELNFLTTKMCDMNIIICTSLAYRFQAWIHRNVKTKGD